MKSLTAGTRLGPYEIVAPIGAGGMGEVYRARDTRLDRTVAIKVLPPEWADSPDMKQRFDREAQVISSLNHPHICKLHDVGDGYLVMEHLDGETLAERLTRGPVPVDEALRIGIAIGDALDQAHRQGVVHRDLKPANVMLTESGPKLLDFGLAKLTGGHAGYGGSGAEVRRGSEASDRPTLTRAGVVLGTLQYMAPEQLDGIEADARTDIFALGVVLYEMFTGRRAFEGKSQALLISAIATTNPPPLSTGVDDAASTRLGPARGATSPSASAWGWGPASIEYLDHVVKTCLAKDPDDRWQTARDVVAELQWIADGSGAAADEAGPAASLPRGQSRAIRFALAGAGFVALALAVPTALYVMRPAAPEKIELRVSINPLTYSGNPTRNGFFAVSPDGGQIVMRANPADGQDALFVGTPDFLSPRRLSGTYSASQVFWSPDGRSIAFVADNKLQRVEAAGGPPQLICDVEEFRGGTWNRDGTIVFGSPKGLFSVRAEGGKPTALTTVASSEAGHFWPWFLPDGRHFLYLSWSVNPADRAAMAGSLDAKDTTRIMPSDSNVVFTTPGYLVFWRERTLYAQPFDAGRLRLSGDPTRLADDISRNATSGRAAFDVSANGVLAYYRDTTESTGTEGDRDNTDRDFQLAWVNRLGQDPRTVGKPGVYRGVELSPDGKRIALHRHDPKGGDVWVFEPNGAETRVTFNASYDNSNPVWSTDGNRLTYASLRNGKWGLYQAASDGSGNEEMLLESELPKAPLQWSPDGQFLLYWVRDPKTADDIWVMPAADKKPRPLIATEANERNGQISPDGKWIAYSSTLDGVSRPGASGPGRAEIFVQPFPVLGTARWQISPDSSTEGGGRWPRWNPKTNELLYRAPVNGPWFATGWMFSVAWQAKGTAFTHEASKQFLRINALNYPHSGGDYHTFAVSPDGQRFLIFQYLLTGGTTAPSDADPAADPAAGVTVLMHWTQTVKK